MTVSFKLLRFHFFINSLIPYVLTPAGIIRYGITPTQATALANLLADWNAKFATYINPLTTGTIAVDAITTCYVDGYPLTQSIRTQVKANTTIVLTSQEKAVFNFKKAGSSSTPAGVPKGIPSLACIGQASQSIELLAINPALPFKQAKPDGVDAIGFTLAIVKPGSLAPARSTYVDQESETSTKSEMLFASASVGDIAYIISFYLNGTLQGKDSLPLIITIV